MGYLITYHPWVIYLPTFGLLTHLPQIGAIKSLHGVIGMKTMKMNNENTDLGLNPKTKNTK